MYNTYTTYMKTSLINLYVRITLAVSLFYSYYIQIYDLCFMYLIRNVHSEIFWRFVLLFIRNDLNIKGIVFEREPSIYQKYNDIKINYRLNALILYNIKKSGTVYILNTSDLEIVSPYIIIFYNNHNHDVMNNRRMVYIDLHEKMFNYMQNSQYEKILFNMIPL